MVNVYRNVNEEKAARNCLEIKIFYFIQSITYNNLKIQKYLQKHTLRNLLRNYHAVSKYIYLYL